MDVDNVLVQKEGNRMIKAKLIQELLKTNESEIERIDTERLRTILGSFRYLVRLFEREINRRSSGRILAGPGLERIQASSKAPEKRRQV